MNISNNINIKKLLEKVMNTYNDNLKKNFNYPNWQPQSPLLLSKVDKETAQELLPLIEVLPDHDKKVDWGGFSEHFPFGIYVFSRKVKEEEVKDLMTVKRLYENSEKFLDTLSQVIKELKEIIGEREREREQKCLQCQGNITGKKEFNGSSIIIYDGKFCGKDCERKYFSSQFSIYKGDSGFDSYIVYCKKCEERVGNRHCYGWLDSKEKEVVKNQNERIKEILNHPADCGGEKLYKPCNSCQSKIDEIDGKYKDWEGEREKMKEHIRNVCVEGQKSDNAQRRAIYPSTMAGYSRCCSLDSETISKCPDCKGTKYKITLSGWTLTKPHFCGDKGNTNRQPNSNIKPKQFQALLSTLTQLQQFFTANNIHSITNQNGNLVITFNQSQTNPNSPPPPQTITEEELSETSTLMEPEQKTMWKKFKEWLKKSGKNKIDKQQLEQEINKLKTQTEQNPDKPIWPWIVGGIGIIAVVGIVLVVVRNKKNKNKI